MSGLCAFMRWTGAHVRHGALLGNMLDFSCNKNEISMIFPRSTMEQFATLMLQVWRIASRHTEIAIATTDIAHLLAQRMPLGQMLVRRIEPERACIETVGIGPDRS